MNRFLDVLAVLGLIAMVILTQILIAVPLRSTEPGCEPLSAGLASGPSWRSCGPERTKVGKSPAQQQNSRERQVQSSPSGWGRTRGTQYTTCKSYPTTVCLHSQRPWRWTWLT
jgi:hypothetical protein